MRRHVAAVLGLSCALAALVAARPAAACDLVAVWEAPASAQLPAGRPVEWRIALRNAGPTPCPPNEVSLTRRGEGRGAQASAIGARQALPALEPRRSVTLRIAEPDPPDAGTHTYALAFATPVRDANPRNHALEKTVSFEPAAQARAATPPAPDLPAATAQKPAPAVKPPPATPGPVAPPGQAEAAQAPPGPRAPTPAPAAIPAAPPTPAAPRAQAQESPLAAARAACDLAASFESPRRDRLRGGKPFEWKVVIRNAGSAPCAPTTVALRREGGPQLGSDPLPPLAPGKQRELRFQEGEPPAEGAHRYTLVFEPPPPGDPDPRNHEIAMTLTFAAQAPARVIPAPAVAAVPEAAPAAAPRAADAAPEALAAPGETDKTARSGTVEIPLGKTEKAPSKGVTPKTPSTSTKASAQTASAPFVVRTARNDSGTNPVPNADVCIGTPDDPIRWAFGRSDAQGDFFWNTPSAGASVRVIGSKAGFDGDKRDVAVSGGAEVQQVVLNLDPDPDESGPRCSLETLAPAWFVPVTIEIVNGADAIVCTGPPSDPFKTGWRADASGKIVVPSWQAFWNVPLDADGTSLRLTAYKPGYQRWESTVNVGTTPPVNYSLQLDAGLSGNPIVLEGGRCEQRAPAPTAVPTPHLNPAPSKVVYDPNLASSFAQGDACALRAVFEHPAEPYQAAGTQIDWRLSFQNYGGAETCPEVRVSLRRAPSGTGDAVTLGGSGAGIQVGPLPPAHRQQVTFREQSTPPPGRYDYSIRYASPVSGVGDGPRWTVEFVEEIECKEFTAPWRPFADQGPSALTVAEQNGFQHTASGSEGCGELSELSIPEPPRLAGRCVFHLFRGRLLAPGWSITDVALDQGQTLLHWPNGAARQAEIDVEERFEAALTHFNPFTPPTIFIGESMDMKYCGPDEPDSWTEAFE